MENGRRKNGGKYYKKQPKRVGLKLLTAVFCFGIVISGYRIWSAAHEDHQAENAYSQLSDAIQKQNYEKDVQAIAAEISDDIVEAPAYGSSGPQRAQAVDFSLFREIAPDIAGWIRGEGTGIDYPIMAGKDNEFYLTHLYDGTENANGSVFLDYRNGGMFTDLNTVIYGHNMKNGTMFNPLNEYKSQDFYDENPTMIVFTPEGDYRIDLICGTVEDGDNEIFQFQFDDDRQFLDYVEGFRKRSTFRSDAVVEPGDKILTMCTCSYEQINARYAVIGKVTELYE